MLHGVPRVAASICKEAFALQHLFSQKTELLHLLPEEGR